MADFEETFRFLDEGDDYITLSNYKNVSLVVGNSGSGKSTFTKFAVGDNTQLFSVNVNGKFIFQDADNDTSASSVSYTIFPKLYDDDLTQTAFFDCPGFNDNRNVSMDIASTYFIKKVIDSAVNIKFIVTASYSDLSFDNERGKSFKSLLEHVSNLVKNVEKYKDSFSLIATKVPLEPSFDGDGNPVGFKTTNDQLNEIDKFLSTLKSELHQSSPFSSDANLLGNSTMLIDAFRVKDNENYQKIGLFKRPTKAGRVSEIKALQDAKIPILKIFHEGTNFIPMNITDFGYTVSDASKNHILTLATNLNLNIEEITKRIADQIVNHYRRKVKEIQDIYKLEEELRKEFDIVDEETKKMPVTDLNSLIYELLFIKNHLEVDISNKVLEKLRHFENYFNIFEALNKAEIKRDVLVWVEPLRNAIKYVDNLKLTYKFFIDLHEYLSSYDIQKNKSKYNVYNLEDWGHDGKLQDIEIKQSNWITFLRKVNLGGYASVLDDKIEDHQLLVLNEILTVTLKEKNNVSCANDKLVIKGDFIKLSEVSKSECKDAATIEILALNTVFIDEDLERIGKKVQLSIIAPKWETIGNKMINLDGLPAAPVEPKKAPNNNDYGGKGSDGVPGLPGGAAGSFLGIGNSFVNGDHLKITSNGGKGSDGQEGGDGGKGKDGGTPQMVYQKKKVREGDKVDICFNEAIDWSYSFQDRIGKRDYHRVTDTGYQVFAKKCQNGGRGGDGGKFGEGGNEGEFHLIGLNEKPQISVSNVKGSNGYGGYGGKGGNRGATGFHQMVIFYIQEYCAGSFVFHCENYYYGCLDDGKIRAIDCAVGESGTLDNITKNKVNPENKVLINPSHLINNYKIFLSQNIKNYARKSLSSSFFKQLTENPEILDFYDTLGLIDELTQMENELFKVRYEIDLIPIYENFLARVLNYSKNPKSNEKTLEHKKILSFVYSTTLSKIVAIREDWENNLITNLEGYLDAAITSINDLKDAQTAVAISDVNKSYKQAITEKTKEAKDFINNQITQEIDRVETQIEGKIEELIIESIDLQEQARNQTHDLIIAQSNLREQIQKEMGFVVIKTIGKALGLFGPWGAAAGEIIDSTASIAETLSSDDEEAASKAVKIPKAAQDLLDGIKKGAEFIRDNKLKVIEKQKEILSSPEAASVSEELADTTELVTSIESNVTESFNNNQMIAEPVNPTVEAHLEAKKKELKEKKTDKAEMAIKVIDKLKTAAKLVEIGAGIYEKFKNDEKRLKEAQKAIDESKANIERLKKYEQSIHSTLVPMINTMKQNIGDLESGLASKSLVALDVSKWQMQTSLKDLKNQLRKFTEGFDAQEDFVEYVEKLIEALNTLIQIYDRIQNYKEQKSLADYIAHINSADVDKIKINDERFKEAVNGLQVAIKSNILLAEYENAMSGVKQFIFPFVGMYLDEFELPSEIDWFKNNTDLADAVVDKIKKLKEKLIKTSTTVTKHDKYVLSGDFKKPFFIWKNEFYRNSFRRLFAGEEISLKADVTKGIDVNAIKFNTIDLLFKSNNASLDEELNRILEANYQLQMTHMGNSYYRCQNKTYFIPSQQQEISFTFAKNNQSQPRIIGDPYKKIKEGNPMLSPYAMWKIKIFMAPTYSLDNPLTRLADEVDLHLVGSGQYVKNEYECSDVGLEEFLDSPSIQTKLLIEEEDKKKRSIRSTNYAHNSAGGFSSPINKFFKWMKNAFVGFQESLGGGKNYVGSTFERKETLKQISPVNFFEQVDSVLVLAPVFHHFWKSFFGHKSLIEQEISFIQISKERVKIWDNFILEAEKVVKILREEFRENQPEVNEYEEALNARKSELNSIISQTEIEAQKVEEFERNLVAFEVDLVDDLDYNENFSRIKKNQEFQFAMKELYESAQVLPNFSRNYKLVKPNYEALSQHNDLMIKKDMQESSLNQIYSDAGHIFNRQNLCISEGSRFEMLRQVN